MMCSGWDYKKYKKENKSKIMTNFQCKNWYCKVGGWVGVNSCDNSLYTKFILQNWAM